MQNEDLLLYFNEFYFDIYLCDMQYIEWLCAVSVGLHTSTFSDMIVDLKSWIKAYNVHHVIALSASWGSKYGEMLYLAPIKPFLHPLLFLV